MAVDFERVAKGFNQERIVVHYQDSKPWTGLPPRRRGKIADSGEIRFRKKHSHGCAFAGRAVDFDLAVVTLHDSGKPWRGPVRFRAPLSW